MGRRYIILPFLISVLDGELSASRFAHLTHGTYWPVGIVGPRVVLEAVEKRRISYPLRESNPGHAVRSLTDWAFILQAEKEGFLFYLMLRWVGLRMDLPFVAHNSSHYWRPIPRHYISLTALSITHNVKQRQQRLASCQRRRKGRMYSGDTGDYWG
jgi:hypothetical protein